MGKIKLIWIFLIIFGFLLGFLFWQKRKPFLKEEEMRGNNGSIQLPKPRLKGEISFEETVLKRRSIRDFANKPLSLGELGQILWAAQGVTDKKTGFRTAPSAGALYPLEIYVVVKEREGLEGVEGGVYHYRPEGHGLELHLDNYGHQGFVTACLSQEACNKAPISLVITAVYERTTGKYGERGRRYVQAEVGHVGQNIYLQVVSLGLGTVTIGAFEDEEVAQILNLPSEHKPLYIMPVGNPW